MGLNIRTVAMKQMCYNDPVSQSKRIEKVEGALKSISAAYGSLSASIRSQSQNLAAYGS
jgi:hypothetical protein